MFKPSRGSTATGAPPENPSPLKSTAAFLFWCSELTLPLCYTFCTHFYYACTTQSGYTLCCTFGYTLYDTFTTDISYTFVTCLADNPCSLIHSSQLGQRLAHSSGNASPTARATPRPQLGQRLAHSSGNASPTARATPRPQLGQQMNLRKIKIRAGG